MRIYKKKTNRPGFDRNLIETVIDLVEGGKSGREVSQSLSIKMTTLACCIKKKQKLVDGEVLQGNLNTRQVFNEMEENDLSQYLRTCSDMFHGQQEL